MSGALFWGLFAASSLIVGGGIALLLPVSERILGLIMAFGAGVLISAVAYELVAEAFDTAAGSGSLALGLAAGALTFFLGDALIDGMGGDKRKSMNQAPGAGSALAIVLGIVLDGIPESAVRPRAPERHGGQRRCDRGGLPFQLARGDRRDDRSQAWRLGAAQDHRPLGARHGGERSRVPARLRTLRFGGHIGTRVRARVRRRRDPDHARRHDDAGGLRARRQARRTADDARLRARVRPVDARMSAR